MSIQKLVILTIFGHDLFKKFKSLLFVFLYTSIKYLTDVKNNAQKGLSDSSRLNL